MGGRTAVRRDLEMVRLLDQTFAQIAANPALVAKADVPWQAVAPARAGAGHRRLQPAAGFAPTSSPALPPVPSTVQADDEDAAEAVRAPDENFAVIHAEGGPRRAAAARAASRQAGAAPSPSRFPPSLRLVAAVSPARGSATPAAAPRPDTQPGRAAEPAGQDGRRAAQAADAPQRARKTPAKAMRMRQPGRNWTVQIGAYADKALAQAQLKAYAGKAQDVLARAEQIVSPIAEPQRPYHVPRPLRPVCASRKRAMSARS